MRNWLNQGWRGRRDRREGYRQRAIRRLFLALDGATVTTRDLITKYQFAALFPLALGGFCFQSAPTRADCGEATIWRALQPSPFADAAAVLA
jgi:hypothetical protein